MKKTIILIGIIGLAFVCGLFLFANHASAISKTQYEIDDDWWGNKINTFNTIGVKESATGTQDGMIIRCDHNITVDEISMYFTSVTGNWSVGYKLMFGVGGLDANYLANHAFLGATGNAFNNVVPVAGWNIITLNESVDMVDGQYYFVGFIDFYNNISTSRYVSENVLNNPIDTARGRPPLGYYEDSDYQYLKYTGTNTKSSWIPWIVRNSKNNDIMGSSYYSSSGFSCYLNNLVCENFTVEQNFSSDMVGVIVCRSSTTSPYTDANLKYKLIWTNNGTQIRSGVLCYPYEISYISRLQRKTFPIFNFKTGVNYSLILYSNTASGRPYVVQTVTSANISYPYGDLTFQGNSAEFSYSSDDVHFYRGAFNGYDMEFMFRRVRPLVEVDTLVNVTYTSESVYIPSVGWSHWLNGTGNTTPISLFKNFLNCFGTHEYNLGDAGYTVWANVTGTGGGGSGLLIDNPNPGNGSTVIANSFGQDTCLNVQYQNFTMLTESNLGTGQLYFYNNTGDTTDCIFLIPHLGAQTFNISTDGFYLKKIGVNLSNVDGSDSQPVYFNITNKDAVTGFPGSVVYASKMVLDSDLLNGWNYITFDSPVSLDVGRYALVIQFNYETEYWRANDSNPITDPDFYSYFYSGGSHSWVLFPNDCMMFEVYGWYPGVNISWNSVVNLSLFSNSTGTWQQYGIVYATSNGTWCMINPNMTNSSTSYWWSIIPSINGTSYPEQVYMFTTGSSLVVVSSDHRILYLGIGGTLGSVLCLVCVPYIFIRRKRQEQI